MTSIFDQSFCNFIKDTYFDHTGRFSRGQFIFSGIILNLLTFMIYPLCPLLSFLGSLKGLAVVLYVIGLMYGYFVIIIKRLHDVDLTGWFSLLLYIPVIGFFFFVYLIFKKGDPGRNQFGLPETVREF